MTSKGTNSSGGVFHDDVKGIVMRWGEGHAYNATMEDRAYTFKKEHPCIPDVVLNLGKDKNRHQTVFIEVQNGLTTEQKRLNYIEECKLKYNTMPFIIIDLININGEVPASDYGGYLYSDIVEWLHIAVSDLMDAGTLLHHPKPDKPYKAPKQADTHMIEYRGHHIKDLRTSKRRVDWIEDKKRRE